jgi:hypothetical protein
MSLVTAILGIICGKAIATPRKSHTITPEVHDYTSDIWGHAVSTSRLLDNGDWRITGFGYGVRLGDHLLLRSIEGIGRYHVLKLEYELDPPDMWKATIRLIT